MTLIDVLDKWARQRPRDTAYSVLGNADIEDSISYAVLAERSRALASRMARQARPGERALLMLPNSIEFMIAYFACLRAGVIAVPVPVPRPQGVNERLALIIRHCSPALIITQDQQDSATFAPLLGAEAQVAHWLAVNGIDADRSGLALPPPGLDAVAMLQYTSGSTTAPKGVKLTHANLLHNQTLIDAAFGLNETDVVLGWLPLFHDMGLMGIALHSLYKGIPSILLAQERFMRRPLSWLRAISETGATTSGAPDFAYELCVRMLRPQDRQNLDLSRWRVAFSGAERVRPRTLARFEQAFADCGFRRHSFLPCYGMAEATLMISGRMPGRSPEVRHFDAQALLEQRRAMETGESPDSIALTGLGCVLPGEHLAIVEPETLQPLAEGAVGEVWVASASVSSGYWHASTDARTYPTWDQARGYLRTGDLGFLHRGELFITARLKDLVIIRGRNLYPEDIEMTVEDGLAGTVTGSVAAFSDEVGGEEKLVVAFESGAGRELAMAALGDRVKRIIGERFEVELHALLAVKRGGLPRTSSGKLRRNDTRRLWQAGALPVLGQVLCDMAAPTFPDAESLRQLSAQVAQSQLVAAMSEWIGPCIEPAALQAERSRSLLAMGLGSVQVIGLIHQLESCYDIRVALAEALGDCTIELLAARVVAHLQAGPPSLPPMHAVAPDADLQATLLSHGQQGIWFAQALRPDSTAYQIARAAEVHPAIDLAALNVALESLSRRHAALRIAITQDQDRPPIQRVLVDATLKPQLFNCETPQALAALLHTEAARSFDFACPPLLRVSVLRTPGRNDVLLLVAHHILCDLWSLSVLLRDLFEAYAAALRGENATQPTLTASYLDQVRAEHRAHASEAWQRRVAYWRDHLGDARTWPSAAAATARQPVAACRMRIVERPLASLLQGIAQQQGLSMQMLLFAAFQLAAAVFEGQDGFLMCSLTNNRAEVERRDLVGYLANLLPMRVRVDRRATVAQWLGDVRRQLLDAYTHELPYEEVLRSCGLREAHELPSRYAFIMQDEGASDAAGFVPFSLGQAGGRWKLAGFELNSLALEETDAQFPLALYAGMHEGRILCRYKAIETAFAPHDIEAVAELFERILRWLAKGEVAVRLNELSWLSEEETGALAAQAQASNRADYLQPRTLLQSFEVQCRATPDRIALEFEDGSWSYAGLHERARSIAAELQGRGVGPETIVGVCMRRSASMVAAIYGVLKAGGAYLPLEPSYPVEYLKTLMVESGLQHVVCDSELVVPWTDHLHGIQLIDAAAAMHKAPGAAAFTPPLPDQLAYVIFTSGSTGRPKGAMNTHAAIVNRLLWMQDAYQLGAMDAVVQKTPYSFDVSVWELFWPLMVGARLVIARPEGHKDPAYLVELLTRGMVTTVHFVPSMLRMFLLEENCTACRTLRTLICSGEALPTSLVRAVADGLAVRMDNLYGPTEAAVDVTAYRCDGEWQSAVQPIGHPIANIHMYVLDEALHALPPGMAGGLYIGGHGLGRGYHHNPRQTAALFVPNPYAVQPGERLYRTGDLGCQHASGLIEFRGRQDGQVKLRGFRIELAEIEAALERHAQVQAAAVVLRQGRAMAAPLNYIDQEALEPAWPPLAEHRQFLRGELVATDASERPAWLIAYCVGEAGVALDAQALQQWLRTQLPEQSVPGVIAFVDMLPLSPNGKLDKRRLPEVELLRPKLASAHRAPRDASERMLVDVWEQVLEVGGIGIDDNFFALGGDSIRALRVIAAARRGGLHFDLAMLFARPTVAQLAGAAPAVGSVPHAPGVEPFALLSAGDRASVPPGVLDAYPLAAVQAGLIYHDESAEGREVYKDVFVYEIEGDFDEAVFHAAVAQLVQRHETLRSAIDLTSFSVPMHLVHAHADVLIETERLDRAPDMVQTRAFVEQLRARSFDWSRPPFFRFAIRVGPGRRFEIFLAFHDLLLDGWSASLLVSELLLTYDRLLGGASVALAPPRVRFADYIAAELAAHRSANARAFYAQYLQGAPVHSFPQRPGGSGAIPRFAVQDVPISAALSAGLRRVAAELGVSAKHVLLAAHVNVLSQVFGDYDVLTGLESNGRLETEQGESVIGMHLNTVPFRVQCRGGTWQELIRQVYAAEQELLPVRRYAYANLQRSLGKGDLVDTVFNYVHFHGFSHLTQLRQLQVKAARGYGASHFAYRSEFSIDPFSGRIHLCLECDTQLVGAALIRDIGDSFATALQAIADDAASRYDRPVRRAPATTVDEEPPATWLSMWLRRVEDSADRIALTHGSQQLSVVAMHARARRWAAQLAARGITQESRVGVLLDAPIAYAVAILAIQLAGGAYVPLNPLQPSERNRKIIADAGIRVLIAASGDLGQLPGAELISPCMLDAGLPGQAAVVTTATIDPDQLGYVIYTSGSTGTPKGVMVSHRNLWFSLKSRLEHYARSEPMVFMLIPSFAFDSSVAVLFWTFALGQRLVFPDTDIRDALAVLEVIRREGVTHLLCTPSYYHSLLTERSETELDSLDTVIMAGEILPASLVARHYQQLPRVAMFNEYGPTEGAVWSSVHRCTPGEDGAVPIGRVRKHVTAQVLDRRRLAAMPGQVGELMLGGEGLVRGYLDNPALTAEAFVPDDSAASPGARVYATGDLVRCAEHGFLLSGRRDRQIKLNGYRIELAEIEHTLRQLPGIEACAVLLHNRADGIVRIHAYVVAASGWVPDHERLAALLPAYMLPHQFLQVASLPLNSNGKVDYTCLRERGEALAEDWRMQQVLAHIECLSDEEAARLLQQFQTELGST
ncbi:non-ribosomal peptide synthetase [Dyella flagellata]|uniref:Carrier domain-containing protein n=1 Tax=Dyella flagellata TaxID=1867833 RepID=A0ABQ5X8F7_9GAMM|nr:non-ribosomal peptide synthetase [Dyella flagellata]GLQ87914.1 hypothetical protein GCM10007898_14820 [Dyella flagellata]